MVIDCQAFINFGRLAPSMTEMYEHLECYRCGITMQLGETMANENRGLRTWAKCPACKLYIFDVNAFFAPS